MLIEPRHAAPGHPAEPHAVAASVPRRSRYVVVDEMHTLSRHLRLARRQRAAAAAAASARHYGARPAFMLLLSATIRNPGELAGRLTGRAGARGRRRRRAARRQALPVLEPAVRRRRRSVERRSANVEAARHAGQRSGARATCRRSRSPSRASPPRWSIATRASGSSAHRARPERIAPLPRRLPAGGAPPHREGACSRASCAGVVSDQRARARRRHRQPRRGVLVGFPRTRREHLAAGGPRRPRAGRRAGGVRGAYNAPIDQYLMRHPDYFFGRSRRGGGHRSRQPLSSWPASARARRSSCRSPHADAAAFGPQTDAILAALGESGETHAIDGRTYWAKSDFPAAKSTCARSPTTCTRS